MRNIILAEPVERIKDITKACSTLVKKLESRLRGRVRGKVRGRVRTSRRIVLKGILKKCFIDFIYHRI